jgi:thiaminase
MGSFDRCKFAYDASGIDSPETLQAFPKNLESGSSVATSTDPRPNIDNILGDTSTKQNNHNDALIPSCEISKEEEKAKKNKKIIVSYVSYIYRGLY